MDWLKKNLIGAAMGIMSQYEHMCSICKSGITDEKDARLNPENSEKIKVMSKTGRITHTICANCVHKLNKCQDCGKSIEKSLGLAKPFCNVSQWEQVCEGCYGKCLGKVVQKLQKKRFSEIELGNREDTFSKLPDEVFGYMLSYLHVDELFRLPFVSASRFSFFMSTDWNFLSGMKLFANPQTECSRFDHEYLDMPLPHRHYFNWCFVNCITENERLEALSLIEFLFHFKNFKGFCDLPTFELGKYATRDLAMLMLKLCEEGGTVLRQINWKKLRSPLLDGYSTMKFFKVLKKNLKKIKDGLVVKCTQSDWNRSIGSEKSLRSKIHNLCLVNDQKKGKGEIEDLILNFETDDSSLKTLELLVDHFSGDEFQPKIKFEGKSTSLKSFKIEYRFFSGGLENLHAIGEKIEDFEIVKLIDDRLIPSPANARLFKMRKEWSSWKLITFKDDVRSKMLKDSFNFENLTRFVVPNVNISSSVEFFSAFLGVDNKNRKLKTLSLMSIPDVTFFGDLFLHFEGLKDLCLDHFWKKKEDNKVREDISINEEEKKKRQEEKEKKLYGFETFYNMFGKIDMMTLSPQQVVRRKSLGRLRSLDINLWGKNMSNSSVEKEGGCPLEIRQVGHLWEWLSCGSNSCLEELRIGYYTIIKFEVNAMTVYRQNYERGGVLMKQQKAELVEILKSNATKLERCVKSLRGLRKFRLGYDGEVKGGDYKLYNTVDEHGKWTVNALCNVLLHTRFCEHLKSLEIGKGFLYTSRNSHLDKKKNISFLTQFVRKLTEKVGERVVLEEFVCDATSSLIHDLKLGGSGLEVFMRIPFRVMRVGSVSAQNLYWMQENKFPKLRTLIYSNIMLKKMEQPDKFTWIKDATGLMPKRIAQYDNYMGTCWKIWRPGMKIVKPIGMFDNAMDVISGVKDYESSRGFAM